MKKRTHSFAAIIVPFLFCAGYLCSSCSVSIQDEDTVQSSPTTQAAGGVAHPLLPVQTEQLALEGSETTILTDAQGFTLYFYVPDTSTVSACTGACAITWPPLLATGTHPVLTATSLPGKLTVQETTNGSQVEYNGHLLYTYLGDSKPGQMTGNGVDSWYTATPDLQKPVG